MLLLRLLLGYSLLLVSLFAQEKDDILNNYYQNLLSIGSFYYELDVTTSEEYVKKILDDDLTLDNLGDVDPTEEKRGLSSDVKNQKLEGIGYYFSDLKDSKFQEAKIIAYRELKESSYISVIKLLKLNVNSNVDNKEKKFSLSKEMMATSYKASKDTCLYTPFIVNNFDINYLDYFMIYYNCYDFNIIKNTSDNYFYKGTLKDKTHNLFNEIQVRFSKKYNILTKIVLKDTKKKTSVSIEVEKVEKIGEVYTGSKFSIYDNGKKIILSAQNISLEIPIDIENNYKISFNEYIDLITNAN